MLSLIIITDNVTSNYLGRVTDALAERGITPAAVVPTPDLPTTDLSPYNVMYLLDVEEITEPGAANVGMALNAGRGLILGYGSGDFNIYSYFGFGNGFSSGQADTKDVTSLVPDHPIMGGKTGEITVQSGVWSYAAKLNQGELAPGVTVLASDGSAYNPQTMISVLEQGVPSGWGLPFGGTVALVGWYGNVSITDDGADIMANAINYVMLGSGGWTPPSTDMIYYFDTKQATYVELASIADTKQILYKHVINHYDTQIEDVTGPIVVDISVAMRATARLSVAANTPEMTDASMSIVADSEMQVSVDVYEMASLSVNMKASSTANVFVKSFVSNEIVIREKSTLRELGRVTRVLNPLVSEQVNDIYEFTFDTVLDENTKLVKYPNIVEVDGGLFQISRIQKVRDSSISISVVCEHVSYRLNNIDSTEGDDDTAAYRYVRRMLDGTEFHLGVVESNWLRSIYIEGNEDNIRKRMIDLASIVAGELEYNGYAINLRNRRGGSNGSSFELGENLVGVTEDIDATSGTPREAYEVGVLDLAHLPEYRHLTQVSLGDTVRVSDPMLEIDKSLRVVRHDYDPFQKVTPTIQIGNVIRDITGYDRPEEEEEEPEEEPEEELTGPAFQSVRIGSYSVLSRGTDISEAAKNGTTYEVTGVIEYHPDSPLVGLSIELREGFEEFHVTVREIGESGSVYTYNSTDFSSMGSYVYPRSGEVQTIEVIVSDSETVSDSKFVEAYGVILKPEGMIFEDQYRMEYGIGAIGSGGASFRFEGEYDDVLSVTTGLIGSQSANVTVVANPVSSGGKYTGLSVISSGGLPQGVRVSLQAVCLIKGREKEEVKNG